MKRNLFLIAPYNQLQDVIIYGTPYIKSKESELKEKIYGSIPEQKSSILLFTFDGQYWITFSFYSNAKESFSERTGQRVTYGVSLAKHNLKKLDIPALISELCMEIEDIFHIPFSKLFHPGFKFLIDADRFKELNQKINSFDEKPLPLRHTAHSKFSIASFENLLLKIVKKTIRTKHNIPKYILAPSLMKKENEFIPAMGRILPDFIIACLNLCISVIEESNVEKAKDRIDIYICQSVSSFDMIKRVKLVDAGTEKVVYCFV